MDSDKGATILGVDQGYLETAAAAGVLRHLDGSAYVAGEFVDPISNERQCLVEYCDPALLAEQSAVDTLTRTLVAGFPQVDSLVLRAPAGVELPATWRRRLTYVRYAGGAGSPPEGVVPAAREHADLTAHWLRQALEHGYRSQGRQPDQAAMAATADQVMAAPDRRTYIALSGGTPVGHVTLLCDRSDEVTGEPIVELYDLLVEAGMDRGGGAVRLVAAAAAHSAGLERPLVGNVVHLPASDGQEHGLRVLDGLLRRGWELDHTFWSVRAHDLAS